MKSFFLILVVSLFSLNLAGASAHKEAPWTDLLAGDSLNAWIFDVSQYVHPDKIWSLEDGVLKVAGADNPTGVIRTKEDFEAFELELEWRWPGKPGNCGVLLYCSQPRFMSIWPKSLEVQLMNQHAGDFYFIGETAQVYKPEQTPYPEDGEEFKEWFYRNRKKLQDGLEKEPGQWNHMRIVSAKDRLIVYVNDGLVNDAFWPSATKGAIALQAEKADIEFRNVRVRPAQNITWKSWNPAQR